MKQAILAASVALSLAAMAPANAAQRLDRYIDVIVTLNDGAAQSRSANLTAQARG